ncbi:MAG: cyclopropane fatty acyl phospholipid synthase [Gammaproteobacteria bacterium]|nr:cyclopropane fatty acyl phospholipid synthase [Gammaproteobacteria bacterium]
MFHQDDSKLFRKMSAMLEKADIQINGNRPWDIQLYSPEVLSKTALLGNLGLGEAYMRGQWDVEQLDEFFNRILQAGLDKEVGSARIWLQDLRARFLNLQTVRRAWHVGEAHYDLGNDFYAAMLDPRMTYTCGYWKDADNLEEAQEAKLDMICRKLELKPGMKVLDIGCGWGSFMGYAAEHYGVSCDGVTISREQAAWAKERYKDLPLNFLLQDYRETYGQYDRVVSVGMFEHVGRKNLRAFMEVAKRCLADHGMLLLHTIGKNETHTAPDPWIDKYIFPNGDLPALTQITRAAEGLLVLEDLHNFGVDYDKTLMAWYANFEAAWPQFSDKMDQTFYRMWRYYLLSCAGAFRARDIQLWQFVYSRRGVLGGYRRPV